jgi:hypothetical protein
MTLEPNVYGACSTGPMRMAAGLKTAMGLHPSWVRIPRPPQCEAGPPKVGPSRIIERCGIREERFGDREADSDGSHALRC